MTKVVNIRVEGIDDELILNSMQVLNQAFFKTSAINQSEDYDLEFKFNEEVEENDLIVTGTLKDDSQVIRRQFESNEAKTRKYAYLAVYLLLLQRETNHIQSWGLLNGMRPTKLVHGMKKRGFTDQEIKSYMQD
ncbi:MAG: coproporphyrinogen dehydrogenase HemZ, partial [Turicibacter sp.]|nr:coproporphyrinogen dehydrogenase HemZ [Turicibacter sp.]